MKKKTTKKTVTIPVKLAEQILDDVETLLTELTGEFYGLRGASLASIAELSKAVGWETPSRELNRLISKSRTQLRKSYAGSGKSDVEAAIDALRYLKDEQDKADKKPRKRKSSK